MNKNKTKINELMRLLAIGVVNGGQSYTTTTTTTTTQPLRDFGILVVAGFNLHAH